ncbi:MAG: hypothetical protein J5812_06295 [Candidatus Methanomethylophilaceae archaeon]|nr:hypothetical protein [Candidatus Methanomethylophilaceae archaeon]
MGPGNGLAFITICGFDEEIKSVYSTNVSDSHSTLSSFDMLGMRLGGTSCAIRVP